MTKLHDFPYLVKRRSYKVGWPLKMTARMNLCHQSGLIYFWALFDEMSTVSILQELHIILNWLTF